VKQNSQEVHTPRYCPDSCRARLDYCCPGTHVQISGDELSWKVKPRPDGSIPIALLRRVSKGSGQM